MQPYVCVKNNICFVAVPIFAAIYPLFHPLVLFGKNDGKENTVNREGIKGKKYMAYATGAISQPFINTMDSVMAVTTVKRNNSHFGGNNSLYPSFFQLISLSFIIVSIFLLVFLQ